VITNGDIIAIDGKEALAMPGVLAVITPDNALKLKPVQQKEQTVGAPLLQDKKIQFNGQHVAVVVADTLERAQAAATRVRIRYNETEFVTDMKSALSQAYAPKHFRNGERSPDSGRGDVDGSFASAPIKIEATYSTPIEHHNPMEPHATIAAWDGDSVTIYTATQGISGAQNTIAALFGMPKENVRVIGPFVGGGFGCKGNTWPPATLAAMAAKMVGRPVKLVLERRQMYTSNGYRPRTIQTIKLAAAQDGTLSSLRHDGFSQMSMPDLGEFSEPFALPSEMMYASPAVAISHRLVAVNQSLPTYMRAPGEAVGMYALESAMDELAVALKMDPIELRLKNYTDVDQHENKPFSSKKLRECYRIGAEKFGWARRTPEPRSMREGRWLVGLGMATSTYPANRQPAQARAIMHADGSVVVRSGTQDLGTGTYTVMTQVAADTLGLPMSRVRFELGDSDFPHAPVSGGSTTVASVSPAVRAACAALREKLFDLVARDPILGLGGFPREQMQLRENAILAGTRRILIGELMARARTDRVTADGAAKSGPERDKYSTHSFGAQFAEVRVDPDLGEIRVARFLGVFDGGRVLNAKTARSQLIGGITFGIGMALLEETLVDDNVGRITNSNIAEYLVPVNADVPRIETVLVENSDTIVDPLGARGLGELPMVGAAAAIANAVFHATGQRVRDLPIRVEDVFA
jgi:xanthine dehydrogenase YagR molybdenum-binding subunit